METRAAAAEVTRQRVLAAAEEAFTQRWYDEVTLRDVAAHAGVALQTVVNHFPTKELLFGAAIEAWGDRIGETRFAAMAGDIAAAIDVLVEDYERTGDTTLRLLALEERVEAVHPPLKRGRAGHQRWVESFFAEALRKVRGSARRRRLAQLIAATDVYTWRLLRKDRGFDLTETKKAITEMVAAITE